MAVQPTEILKKAGYAIINNSKVIEASPLPPGISSQKAELIDLTQALTLAKDKIINMQTDSKYTFSILHTHAAIWQESSLITKRPPSLIHLSLLN